MVSDTQFFRKANEAEKAEYVELNGKKNPSILNMFCAQLAKVQQKFQKIYRPFDSFGARMDFEASIREQSGDSSMLDKPAGEFKLNIDLDIYGDVTRFNFIGSKDTIDDKLLDGIRQSVMIGKHYDFKGKGRNNGVTVYVPLDKCSEMDKWIEDSFGTGKKKVETENKREVK